MLPPGLGFNAISEKALAAAASRRGCPAPTGTGSEMIDGQRDGCFPYTPATNLLYGLREALRDARGGGAATTVFARHGATPRRRARAVRAWGLEILCQDPTEYSARSRPW